MTTDSTIDRIAAEAAAKRIVPDHIWKLIFDMDHDLTHLAGIAACIVDLKENADQEGRDYLAGQLLGLYRRLDEKHKALFNLASGRAADDNGGSQFGRAAA